MVSQQGRQCPWPFSVTLHPFFLPLARVHPCFCTGAQIQCIFCVCRKDLHFQPHLRSILKAEYLTPGSGLHSRQMPARPPSLVLFPVSDLAQIPCHTRGAIWLGILCPCQTFYVEGCGNHLMKGCWCERGQA